MAFAVPQPVCKRLKVMEPSGKEIRGGWDPLDMSYMQLLDSAGQVEDGPAEKEEEAPPDPGEVIKVFEDAKGNLDIMVDVVTNLERSFLEAKPFSAGRRPGVRREDAVANSLQARVAATAGSLGRVAARLQQGAELLQAHVEREERFYCQLRQLQMFWKIHLNPRVIDCPFMVDLSLPEPSVLPPAAAAAAAGGAAADGGAAATGAGGAGSASGGSAAGGGATSTASQVAAGQSLTGNTYELGSGALLVPLMKDEGGALRVQLELPGERPDVNDAARVGSTRLNAKGARTQQVRGARAVHALLLQLQRRQLWRQVAAGLERDAAGLGAAAAGGGGGGGGGHPVHVSLARLASQNVLRTSDPALAALRPLMLEHLLACRLPQPYKPPPPPPPRPGCGPRCLPPGGLAGLPLLPDLAALLNQAVFRSHQVHHLELEAHALPYITLRWRPCAASLLSSAVEVRIGPSHRVMVLIRDGRTDVEGVVQPTGAAAGSGAGGSRWVRDTHMSFSRHDVPCVLRSVLQTLGMPLDRLLGAGVAIAMQQQQHAGGGGGGGGVQQLPTHGSARLAAAAATAGHPQQHSPQQLMQQQHRPPHQQQQQGGSVSHEVVGGGGGGGGGADVGTALTPMDLEQQHQQLGGAACHRARQAAGASPTAAAGYPPLPAVPALPPQQQQPQEQWQWQRPPPQQQPHVEQPQQAVLPPGAPQQPQLPQLPQLQTQMHQQPQPQPQACYNNPPPSAVPGMYGQQPAPQSMQAPVQQVPQQLPYQQPQPQPQPQQQEPVATQVPQAGMWGQHPQQQQQPQGYLPPQPQPQPQPLYGTAGQPGGGLPGGLGAGGFVGWSRG